MKVLIRLAEAALAVFLLLLTVCTAAYRLDPDVSPEVGAASGQSLSERITTVLTDLGSGVADSVSETGSALASSAEMATRYEMRRIFPVMCRTPAYSLRRESSQ